MSIWRAVGPGRRANAAAVLAGMVLVSCIAAAAVTYRSAADGPFGAFVAGLAFAGAAGLVSLEWFRRRGAPWPLLAVGPLLVASVAPGVHIARLVHRHMVIETSLDEPLAFRRIVEPDLRNGATLAATHEEITLHTPAGSIGYLAVRQDTRGGDRGSFEGVFLPRVLSGGRGARADEVTVTTRVDLDNAYFVLLDVGTVVAQVTRWGVALTLTTSAGPRGVDVAAAEVATGWHRWTLARAPGSTRLSLDGRNVWVGEETGEWPYVRLGETRTDPEHGGTLRLRGLSLRRAAL